MNLKQAGRTHGAIDPGGARPTPSASARHTGGFSQDERFAQGLGWFGIGLGIAELAAPGTVARMIGLPSGRPALIRTLGLREIASGIGIVTQRAPAGAVWSRVAGDAVDLACLGAAFMTPRANRARVAAAAAAVAGTAVLDVLCAQQLSRGADTTSGARSVKAAIEIHLSMEDVYRYWRDFSHFPRFMKCVKQVHITGPRHSHWVVSGPAGSHLEWDAEITEEQPNECIAWRSLEGSDVDHAGTVRFEEAPAGRGTLVSVDMHYRPPAGGLGTAVAALFGDEPSQTVKADLRRFKQMMETGEVVTTEGQAAGRSRSTSWKYDQAVKR